MKQKKHLSILVPDGDNNISSITGAFEIVSKANGFWKQKTGSELLNIQLVGVSKQVEFNEGLFVVKPHVLIEDIKSTDLIIIPSLSHNYENALAGNEIILPWLEQHYKCGAEIATICTGAFLLAEAGLLDGRMCSTHWSVKENFKMRFPKVDLQIDRLITDENGIYTNGGAYSFLNLMVYLIEKYFDRETAIFCSKVFQVEMDRLTQSEFAIFTGQKKHGDEIVYHAQIYIEKHIQEKVNMEDLAAKFNIGRRNFDRRFLKATGNSPLEYAQRVKIELAKKSFETNRKTINEVMYEVGYSDMKAFREVFRKITGISPLSYKAKYNKVLN